MDQNTIERIAEIEREIAVLPAGGVSKKNVHGNIYYYHRITQNGKRIENYVKADEVDELISNIEKRKKLEKELKKLKQCMPKEKNLDFKTKVLVGDRLKSLVSVIRNYKKRECIQMLRDYIFKDIADKVFILYGLRRTGKTTLIRQIILELSESDFNKAAFIQVTSRDSLSEIDEDLRLLEKNGYKYVFLDEVTLMEDFIEGASLFSDIYASSGMKIVLSGTDSLGFAFSKEEQLYDRCIMLHTTFIPYREFENVLGIYGIDEYIRYGGTMSLGGINYNASTPFSNIKDTEEYINTSIAKNIQHSLKMYQYGGHFRQLLDLYEKGELTNVINRVVEDMNHRFTKSVVERITANNLLGDRVDSLNLDKVTLGIKNMLDILNKEEQSIDISDVHMTQIKEYLAILDLIKEIDLEYLPEVNQKSKIIVVTQPGLRYAQAEAIVENLLLDENFQELDIQKRTRILERLLSEIRGRMMEDIVLLETKLAKKDKHVFKLQFPIGEFGMVVQDPKTLSCEIYEIKYSKERACEQYRHINDEEKCAMTTHRYGNITGRYVIYRGENTEMDTIQYLNVENYLKSL
ncbi:AAA family ATPase [Holdemanella biformis]|uniref:AAA family ATPase n=1 Tax=Holdemanella biformis TaxID=1735 RepID=UPI002E781AD8|nr:AAA family ATPase [Holdemanella biformis]MEE0395646.1 AAA family ATPase [Holdemanella biformis]